MDTTTPTLVIARYKEDISWAKDKPHVVIQKGEDIPNVGREISSWFWFIIQNYDKLEGEYIFCQGNPFDHAPNIIDAQNYKCKPDGSPHHPGLPIHEVATELGLPILDEYVFKPGAQHKISAEEIKRKPITWYAKALYLSLQEDKQYPWCFERLVNYLYN